MIGTRSSAGACRSPRCLSQSKRLFISSVDVTFSSLLCFRCTFHFQHINTCTTPRLVISPPTFTTWKVQGGWEFIFLFWFSPIMDESVAQLGSSCLVLCQTAHQRETEDGQSADNEGWRKKVCQFPQYAIQDFQRHQRKLSTLQSHIHSPAFRGHGHTAKCLMQQHRQESTKLPEAQSSHLEIIEPLFSPLTSMTNKHTLQLAKEKGNQMLIQSDRVTLFRCDATSEQCKNIYCVKKYITTY